MTQRVGYEIGQHLIKPVIISGEMLMRISDDGDQVNALGCSLGSKARSEVRDQVSE